jgi:REP element-mobilizing transposase RayT
VREAREVDEVRRRGARVNLIMPGDLVITRRHLPHWEVGGSVYFVTFSTQGLELNEIARRVVLNSCLYWHGRRIEQHVVCVMPDHTHMILQPLVRSDGGNKVAVPPTYCSLSSILHSIKSYSSRQVNRLMDRSGPLWMEESYDRIIRSEADYMGKWDYIRSNPVKAGFVEVPEDYAFLWQRDDWLW